MKWEIAKLGDLATFINGYPFKPSEWASSGIEIIRIQNLTKSGGESNYFQGTIPSKYKVVKGDILISWSATLDIFEWNGDDAWLNQHIFKVQFDKIEIDKRYFKFLIKYILGDLRKQVHGATMQHITKGKFDNMPVPLPPLSTQKRIAEILDKADALRQKDQALLRKYDELAQAVFVDMFGDPVRNEKGWEVHRFDKIFDSRLGKMLDTKKQTQKNAYKYLGNSNVQWGKCNMNNLQEMDFDDKDKVTFKLQKGDLLICEGGEVGRTAIWEGKFENIFFQKAIHRARPIEKNITPEFAMKLMWFLAKFGGLDDYVTSATIAHLTGEKLKTIMIPLPPISLQLRFSNCLNNINFQKGQLEQETSESLFQSLLQKAFTGELVA